MRIWFDTEFYENGRTIDLISIGLIREDGATYYAETIMADVYCHQSEWLTANVLPHLRGPCRPRATIAREIIEFVGPSPQFWAYYADYDWVVLCQLYGRMIDLPKGWPMYCRDIKQLCDELGNPDLPEQQEGEHYALADAEWAKQAWEVLAHQTVRVDA